MVASFLWSPREDSGARLKRLRYEPAAPQSLSRNKRTQPRHLPRSALSRTLRRLGKRRSLRSLTPLPGKGAYQYPSIATLRPRAFGGKGADGEWHGNKRYCRWKQRCKKGYMTAPLLGVVRRASAGGARSSVPVWEPTELPAGKQELAPPFNEAESPPEGGCAGPPIYSLNPVPFVPMVLKSLRWGAGKRPPGATGAW